MQTTFNSTAASAKGAADTVQSNNSQANDMFTKLLVAQIKNQDPLSPSDPSQFVNQLAQLSQTEALQNLATLTSNNASVLQSMQVLALGAQVGSDVQVTTDRVTLGDGAVKGSFDLASAATKTTLVLTGADGQSHSIELGAQGTGAVPFGINPQALGLPAGTYSMRVETVPVQTPPSVGIEGKLHSVRLSSAGSVLLTVDHVGEVAPSAVSAFNGKSSNLAAMFASSQR